MDNIDLRRLSVQDRMDNIKREELTREQVNFIRNSSIKKPLLQEGLFLKPELEIDTKIGVDLLPKAFSQISVFELAELSKKEIEDFEFKKMDVDSFYNDLIKRRI